MNNPLIQTVVAGICFGIWPLLANKSGVNGSFSSFVVATVVLLAVIPTAIGSFQNAPLLGWLLILVAGITSATGMILFCKMMGSNTAEKASLYFIIVIITQLSIPAIYSIYLSLINGETIGLRKIVGIVLAFIVVKLLS